MTKSKQHHLARTILSNVGGDGLRAYRVMLYIASWGMATKKLGHAPVNVEEYAAWWKKTRATAYREQELFREALPMHKNPTAICEWLEQTDPALFQAPKASAPAAAFKVGGLL